MGGARLGQSRRPASVAFTPDETRVPVVVPHRPRYRPSTRGRSRRRSGRPGAAARACVREAQRTRPVRQLARPPAVHGTMVDGGAAGGRGSSPGSSSFFLHVLRSQWLSVGSSTSPASVAERRPLFAQL